MATFSLTIRQGLCVNILFTFFTIAGTSCNTSLQKTLPSSYNYDGIKFSKSLINDCDCTVDTSHYVCIRKCCDVNYVLRNKSCVYSETIDFTRIVKDSEILRDSNETTIRYVVGVSNCLNGRYALDYFYFQIDHNGLLHEKGIKEPVPMEEFCVDWFNDRGVRALVCLIDEPVETAEIVTTIGMLVSVPFLLATFIVYAILPQRKLHGNALMCYVISLLGGFTLLAILRLKKYGFSEIACMSVVVPCIFFFLASFFWMNVMSIDIFWTFSGIGGFKGNRKDSENRRFLIYSAYAWGAPLLVGILLIALSTSPYIPREAWYNPGVGRGTACWFRRALQELIYFYGPLSFLTITNVLLFAVTAYKIRRAQKDTAVLRKTDSQKHGDDDAQRFSLYLKLLLVMGLNWTMEVVSYAVDWQVGKVPPAVWYITDFCNALYGVLIFFLFCFNKKTWNLLKLRFNYGNRPETSRFSTQTTAEAKPLNSKK